MYTSYRSITEYEECQFKTKRQQGGSGTEILQVERGGWEEGEGEGE